MNGAPDFVIPADDRIELALACEFGQIAAVFFQGLVGAFRILACHPLIATNLLQGCEETVSCQIEPAKYAAFLDHRKDHMLDADELVAQFLHLVFGLCQHCAEPRREMYLSGSSAWP